ncbi:thioredoxin domain-containing protein [Streptomyces sp. So13.3]|nr:thioredoxin domain-containing protein [Streptomyces sp. So13.3]
MGWSSTGCAGGGSRSEPAPVVEQTIATGSKDSAAGLKYLPEKLGADGITITVGDPGAPVTVLLYEDPRCPVCEEFELTGAGPALQALTVQRDVKTQYVLASFLDERLGGSGSKKAVNALRAALDAGKFAEYHAVLYQNQPEESVDGYTDAFLLQQATKVAGLRSPAFDSAVKTMKYRAFVSASQTAYDAATPDHRGPGTPTGVINGRRIPEAYSGVLFEPSTFRMLMRAVQQDPAAWLTLK